MDPMCHTWVRRTSLAERCTRRSHLNPPDLMLPTCALGRRLRARGRGSPSLRTALRVNLRYVYCDRLFGSIEHLLLVLLDPLLEIAVRKERLLERLACQRAQGVASRKHLMREIKGDQRRSGRLSGERRGWRVASTVAMALRS